MLQTGAVFCLTAVSNTPPGGFVCVAVAKPHSDYHECFMTPKVVIKVERILGRTAFTICTLEGSRTAAMFGPRRSRQTPYHFWRQSSDRRRTPGPKGRSGGTVHRSPRSERPGTGSSEMMASSLLDSLRARNSRVCWKQCQENGHWANGTETYHTRREQHKG